MTQNNLSEQNPYVDPRYKNVWDKGYAAGLQSATEELERLRKQIEELSIIK